MIVKYFFKNNLKNKFIAYILILMLIIPFFYVFSHYQSAEGEEIQNFEDSINLPVLMYHLILKNPKNKNKFVISQKTFEEDLEYIKNNGYTTILVQDLIDYTEGKTKLPQKPILLTFDDGAYNNYLYAFPLAKKYGAKFVFSPIAFESEKYSNIKDENPNYSYANWDQIREMSDSGLVEIQNHTYNMHCSKNPRVGCTKKFGESEEIYKKNLSEDILKSQELIEKHTGKKPTAFFYPFGACSKCSEKIIQNLGFKATFLCEGRVNKISKNPKCLFRLKRFLRPPDIPAEKIFSQFEK